ncbi:MAG TPA: hypothetical protein VLG11_03115 [Candidatus Saccharimonadales bacterium]|nr:hypothetical protein [Candidatus Saccharimonadales bacterium]
MRTTRRLIGTALLLAVIAGGALLYANRYQIYDWARLQNYQPPAAISQLASDDTMSPYAQHMFYVNRPDLTTDKTFFNQKCGNKEQTIVLGCYRSAETGIYLYDITDPRLAGVEQVTAAHETLHAIYERLSSKQRASVDTMLLDYYNNNLQDQRIKQNIDLYKKIEPNDVVNEMHSIFGTEIASLPPPLENYYKQYFTDRQKIAQYAADYEGAFTSRQNEVAADDTQLAAMKKQIDADNQDLTQRQQALIAQKSQMDAELNKGQTAAYNAQVAPYNAAVDAYNNEVAALKTLVAQYNALVDRRNAIAIEENQLTQALSSQATPIPAQ